MTRKWAKDVEIFHGRGYMDDKQAHEKMITVTRYSGNANQAMMKCLYTSITIAKIKKKK